MGIFGFKKRVLPLPLSSEPDMDIPPKPPTFNIESPLEPSFEEIEALKPKIDDLEAPISFTELPSLEPSKPAQQEITQAIQQIQEHPPSMIPALQPLSHEEYILTQQPAPALPAHEPHGDSVFLKEQGPLFVTLEGYEQILTNAIKIRTGLQKAEDRVAGLNSAKNAEEINYGKLQQAVEHIERKLSYIDGMLFGAIEG